MNMDIEREAAEFGRKYWWLFLVTGILWFLLSLFILRFNTQSLTTIGILIPSANASAASLPTET